MLRAIIVDDDPIILRRLINLLHQTDEVVVTEELQSGQEYIDLLLDTPHDFVILDIDLPDFNGIELAKIIRKVKPNFPIIFLTGHVDFVLESYEVEATDYLLKPIDPSRVQLAIEKVKRRLNVTDTAVFDRIEALLLSPGKIAVKVEANLLFLEMEEIVFIKKDGKKTAILAIENNQNVQKESIYMTRDSMKDIHQRLDQNLFIRTHNSNIVNVKWIHEVIPYTTETYKITFKHTEDFALLNRSKLYELIQQVR